MISDKVMLNGKAVDVGQFSPAAREQIAKALTDDEPERNDAVQQERKPSSSASLAEIAARIRLAHQAVATSLKCGIEYAITAGELLIKAKKQIPHGQWLPWLDEHCGVTSRSAQGYMKLARNRDKLEAKTKALAHLTIEGALKALTSRSLIPKNGNDKVLTPDDLALKIVKHFKSKISGKVLEPCAGDGSFVRALKQEGYNPIELEIDRGLDFFDYNKTVNWIITNPPWSKAREFALHSYQLSQDIVFLITLNHFIALKARFQDMYEAGFGICEILLVDTPPSFPQSGFQLGAIHFQKGWKGKLEFTSLDCE